MNSSPVVHNFRSYINLDIGKHSDLNLHSSAQTVEQLGFARQQQHQQLQLLSGETQVACADGVQLLLQPVSLSSSSDDLLQQQQQLQQQQLQQLVFGRVVVTNLRLIFQPDTTNACSTAATLGAKWHRLLGANDVCLANVDHIYQLGSQSRRRLLAPHSVVTGRLKGLIIRCKDFRVVTLKFMSWSVQCRDVAGALLVYAYPRMPHLLFAFYHRATPAAAAAAAAAALSDTSTTVASSCCDFNSSDDWLHELARRPTSGWRVSLINFNYTLAPSLPRAIVVPESLSDVQLMRLSSVYVAGRLPVWCCSHSNGASIMRSALLSTDSASSPALVPSPSTASLSSCTSPALERNSVIMDQFVESVRSMHAEGRAPVSINVSSCCPSLTELHDSYCRLRELCIPMYGSDASNQDGRWLSMLSSTRWPQTVLACLAAAADVVQHVHVRGLSVIISDETGRDLSAAVSSLAQLLLEPRCRTLAGFQRLIDKEWVALAHPFQRRHGLVLSDRAEQSAVFLLFLDCVHQCVAQFPGQFEFTQLYLVCVWDSCLLPIFDTFLFDCHRDRSAATATATAATTAATAATATATTAAATATATAANGATEVPLVRRSVWDWHLQFSAKHQQLFYDPLYRLAQLDLTRQPLSSRSGSRSGSGGRASHVAQNHATNSSHTYNAKDTGCGSTVASSATATPLHVQTAVSAYRLWSLCHCRWLPRVNVPRSGPVASTICCRRLADQWLSAQTATNGAAAAAAGGGGGGGGGGRAVDSGVGVTFGVKLRTKRTASSATATATASLPNSHYPFLVSDTLAPAAVSPGAGGARRRFITNIRNSFVAPPAADRL